MSALYLLIYTESRCSKNHNALCHLTDATSFICNMACGGRTAVWWARWREKKSEHECSIVSAKRFISVRRKGTSNWMAQTHFCGFCVWLIICFLYFSAFILGLETYSPNIGGCKFSSSVEPPVPFRFSLDYTEKGGECGIDSESGRAGGGEEGGG